MPTSSRSRVTAVLLAAVVLIGGANLAAYAANGQPLLMGKTNTATKKTTVKNNGSGPALHLKTQPGQAPLKVNRTKKVNKLNADLVDGASASDLQTTAYRYQVPPSAAAATHQVAFPGLPAGPYLMTYSIISFNGDPLCLTQGSRRGLSYSVAQGPYATNNASAIIDTTGGPETLFCAGGASFQIYSTEGDAVSEVTFTRLDTVTEQAPTVSRPSAERRPGGATGR